MTADSTQKTRLKVCSPGTRTGRATPALATMAVPITPAYQLGPRCRIRLTGSGEGDGGGGGGAAMCPP
ncbi:hypothetical protein GCM10017778_33270 [Streptomyces vinaceus]|nr:hypothetical protein GCM10017778_33270 [Streptomyces vinaceus]